MAAKKNFGAKAEFIRGMPANMTATQIIEEAKKRGLKITSSHIYNLRAKSAGGSRGKGAKTRALRARSGTQFRHGAEAALRAAIAEIGLARARQVMAEVEAKFGSKS